MKKICLILTMFLLVGCSSSTKQSREIKKEKINELSIENKSISKPKLKDETVYVKLKDNNITQIKDEVRLDINNKSDLIIDKTNLTNIKNSVGEENLKVINNNLYIENKNKSITYNGLSNKDLPITIKYTYYLNNEEMSYSNIKNKQGHIKIKIETINHTNIPFTCISLLQLDESFTNIKLNNAKETIVNNETMIMGYTMPYLNKLLNVNDIFPEVIEIEADTSSFQLEFNNTIVTNGLFKEIKDKDINNIEDIFKSLNTLSSSSTQISEGINTLVKGSSSYKEGLNTYINSINKVLSLTNDNNVKKILNELKTFDVSKINNRLNEVENLTDKQKEEIIKIIKEETDIFKSLNNINIDTHNVNQIIEAGNKLKESYNTLHEGLVKLNTSYNLFDKQGIKQLNKITNKQDIINKVKQLKQNDISYTNYSDKDNDVSSSVKFIYEVEY